jgi:hypothetical protein
MTLMRNEITYPIFTNSLNFNVTTCSLKPNTDLFYELPFEVAVPHFYLAMVSAVLRGRGKFRRWQRQAAAFCVHRRSRMI